MLPHLYLFRLSFLAAFPFCYFFQVSRILPYQVKSFPSYFPLWFFFLDYPKWLLKFAPSWILDFKSFGPTILLFCELNPFLILLSMGLAQCAISLGLVS